MSSKKFLIDIQGVLEGTAIIKDIDGYPIKLIPVGQRHAELLHKILSQCETCKKCVKNKKEFDDTFESIKYIVDQFNI